MKEAKIIIRDNYKSDSVEERKEIIKKNIVRYLVKECTRKLSE